MCARGRGSGRLRGPPTAAAPGSTEAGILGPARAALVLCSGSDRLSFGAGNYKSALLETFPSMGGARQHRGCILFLRSSAKRGGGGSQGQRQEKTINRPRMCGASTFWAPLPRHAALSPAQRGTGRPRSADEETRPGWGRDPSACHLAQGQSRAQGPGGCEGSTFTRRGAGSCRSRWEPAINTMLTPVTLASRPPAQAQGQNSRSRQPAAAPRSAGCSPHPNEVPHFLTGSALCEVLSWLSPKRGALRVKQATRPPAALGRAGSDSPGRGPRV